MSKKDVAEQTMNKGKPKGKLAIGIIGEMNRSNTEARIKKKGRRDLAGKKQRRNTTCCCGSGKKAKDCCVFFPQGMGGIS
jgi:uncharacterized protein YecA (UPF0149 family)|tara:strand:- start:807 stop:1046 length:240 start_codon:yes stop_codon:yes gene_type:complete